MNFHLRLYPRKIKKLMMVVQAIQPKEVRLQAKLCLIEARVLTRLKTTSRLSLNAWRRRRQPPRKKKTMPSIKRGIQNSTVSTISFSQKVHEATVKEK